MSVRSPSQVPLAVVGVGSLFPGSHRVTGFWQDILAGRDLIGDVPPHYWRTEDYYDPDPRAPDKVYCKRGAFLSPVEFDPLEFGIPPNVLPTTDTAQLLALVVAQRVLEEAAIGHFAELDRDRISVILGVAAGLELVGEMASRLQRPVWIKALRESGVPEDEAQAICDRIADHYVEWKESTFPGLLGNVVAGRIANRFDLGGTNCTTDAACASSFAALWMAAGELSLGSSDLVITGGVDTTNDPFLYTCFCKTPALSPTGDCRPFSEDADGTMLGEGIGMVALRRLADAERDGNRIYAVIRGIGTSSDGKATSVYSPRPEGQAKALRRAYQAAGYGPETVELVEGHGTGTKAGDPPEFAGLATVFDESGRSDRQWCALGSIKSQIGHTKASAAAAGLIKVVMALHHKVLPPTIKVRCPAEKLNVSASPFYLNTETRPWIRDGAHPRRGSVSSFGFGGTNYHLTVEEHDSSRERTPRLRGATVELVVLSGDSTAALVAACERVAEEAELPGTLAHLARDSQRSVNARAAARLAVVASDEDDLRRKLSEAAGAIAEAGDGASFSRPNGTCFSSAELRQGRVAFLFPGQGSQYLAMGAEPAMAFDEARSVWDREAAQPTCAEGPLHSIVFPRPVFRDEDRAALTARLKATEWAQPAIGAVSASLLALLRKLGLQADCVAGHSFGEVTALHAAGVLDEAALLRVARKRGELMAAAASQAAEEGTMTAVVAARETVESVLVSSETDVTLANHNAPEQVVLSGTTRAIAQVEQRLAQQGIKFRRLEVATAFHSALVSGSAEPFGAFLRDVPFAAARCAVYGNATAVPYPDAPEAMRELLASSIARPVRFVEQIDAMAAAGVHTFVEVGPGAVLTELVGRCLADRPHLAVSLDRKGSAGLTSLWRALGALVVAGHCLELEALWADDRLPPDPRTKKKPVLSVALDGANLGRAYPPPPGAMAEPPSAPKTVQRSAAPPAAETAPQPVARAAQRPTPTAPPATVAPHDDPTPVQSAAPPRAVPAPQPPAPAPMTTPPRDGPDAWLAAYQEIQRQTAEAHAAYQRMTADSHLAFLKAAEASSMALAAMATGQPLPELALHGTPLIATGAAPAPAWQPSAPPQPMAQPSAPIAPPPAPAVAAPASAVVDATPAEPAATPAAAPVPVGGTELATADMKQLLLTVVADKTGYPEEILELEMALEADLGIDSIKRVEILSAVKDQAPAMPEVDASEMAKLQTLGQVLAYMEQFRDGLEPPAEAGAAPTAEPASAEPAETATAPLAPSPEAFVRHGVSLEPAPASGFCMPGLLAGSGPVAVVDDGQGVAPALAALLRQRGLQTEVVERVGAFSVAGVIFLAGLGSFVDARAAMAVNRDAFVAAQQVAPRLGEAGGLFVTVMDCGGDFGLSGAAADRAWAAGLTGLVKTAAQEWPRAALKAIDLPWAGRSAEQLAAAILDELVTGGPELEVALPADGARAVVRSQAAPAGQEPTEFRLSEGAVLVVSGGARGVTPASLLELCRLHRPRLALLGRSSLVEEDDTTRGAADDASLKRVLLADAQRRGRTLSPADLEATAGPIRKSREIRDHLSALQQAGAEVRYVAVDVTDEAAVRRSLEQVRGDWGPIHGLVHGAGVLADKPIAEKTIDQFDRVFDTKVQGLAHLLAATADDPLELILLFSSVAARFGNIGQCDYAMANEVLNKVAAVQAVARGPQCLVRSLGWGPWRGGMVSPALERHFAERGVPLIPLDVGASLLADELRVSGGPHEVLLGGMTGTEQPSPTARDGSYELLVDRATNPHLDDHRINGVVVIPAVMVLEWFARAARLRRPDLQVVAVRELKVLSGIQLPHFDDDLAASRPLQVVCRQLSDGGQSVQELSLLDGTGRRRYSATVEMKRDHATARTSGIDPAEVVGESWPWPSGAIYDEQLFHTGRFQVVEALEGVSSQGGAAQLGTITSMGWPAGGWQTDAAALDGGLQLAILWGARQLGSPSLPTRIGAYYRYHDGPYPGPVHCALRGRAEGASRTVCDLAFCTADGTMVAELRDVELHVMPGPAGRAADDPPDRLAADPRAELEE
ncbi:MAG: SDR family oxidoreductase [Deltaproteobacteria bacterium]|nr:SDR family oxidoreductase [Deltaproteobacteria bacterium]